MRGMLSAKLAAAPLHPFFIRASHPKRFRMTIPGFDGDTNRRCWYALPALEYSMPAKESLP